MPGKQARVLCPVCQEPIPPDETECETCGAFVMDEAVVRLSRAFGLDRDHALKLFEAGFRHPTQLRDRDPNRVLESGEVGLLFICTNCGGFVAAGDSKCPRCAAEFEAEPESPAAEEEEDILDLVLCPVCGADNDPELKECEICGEALHGEIARPAAAPRPTPPSVLELPEPPTWPERFVPRPAPPARRMPEPARPPSVRKVPPPAIAPQRAAPTMRKEAPRTGRPPAIARPPIERPTRTLPPARPAVPPRPTPRPRSEAKVRPSPPTQARATRMRPPPAVSESRREPIRPPAPVRPPAPRKASAPRSTALPQKQIRPPERVEFSPETYAGLVLAAGAGLLIAGILGQRLVSVGIAGVLAALSKNIVDRLRRHTLPRPPDLEVDVLIVGVAFGILAPFFRGGAALAGMSLALASASCFAWLTLRLVRTPQRILLAAGCGLALFAQGLVEYLDPTYAMTPSWMVGVLVAMPWPAAVAAVEILRRQGATVLRHQVLRAEQNVERNDFEQSLAEYDRAIAATSPDTPGAEVPWYGKGATLILLGRYEEALRAIDRALDINPHNEVAWVNKGNALSRMGRPLDALRTFNAAIKVNPLYEVAWNNKGNALARLGKYEEALRCYERALHIDSGYRGAWVNMGFVLTKMGRFDEAASCADHALQLERKGRAEPS